MAAATRAASAEAIADGTTPNISSPTTVDLRWRTYCLNHGDRPPRRAGFPSKGRWHKLLQSDPAGRAREADQEQRAVGLPVEFGRLTGFDPQAGKGTELRIVM